MTILIGPAGTGGDSLNGLDIIKKKGLDACEIEFVRGVKMSNELAKKVGNQARKLGLELSVHAPYYVNLASEDSIKRKASIKRILDSCERGHYLGAKKIVFHPGYYIKDNKEKTFEVISDSISQMLDLIKSKEWDIKLAPETMGKINVFGSFQDIMRLHRETGCSYCIDYAHLYARNLGKIDFDEINSKLNGDVHAHFSGINFTDKGEQSHKLTNIHQVKELFESIKKFKLNVTIINESPEPIKDAVKMVRLRENIF